MPSDLIYREDAKDFVRYAHHEGMDPVEYLDEVPAADVRPVVRGEWANEHLASTSGGTYAVIRCSVCKSQFPLYKTNYCPSCGADMREEGSDG